MLLNGPGPLDFSSRTLYFRVEKARSLYVGEAFLGALRRYYSVAVDLWTIGNLTFASGFQPKSRFLFMGEQKWRCLSCLVVAASRSSFQWQRKDSYLERIEIQTNTAKLCFEAF